MAAVKEHIFLVGGSDTTYNNTSWLVSLVLSVVLEMIFLSYIVTHCLENLDTLEDSLVIFFYSYMYIV